MLCLPGKRLDVSWLINKKKKFRNRGGRDGAMAAMKNLELDGLGNLLPRKSKGSIQVKSKTCVACVCSVCVCGGGCLDPSLPPMEGKKRGCE